MSHVKSCQIVQIWGKWGVIAIIRQASTPAHIHGDNWWSKVSDGFSFWCVMCHD